VVAGAIFTLAGVIAGAIAAGAIRLFFERRQDARQLRVAARIVSHRFAWGIASIEAVVDGETWGPLDQAVHREPGDLEQHNSVLSAHLTEDQWTAVSGAERFLHMIVVTMQHEEPVPKAAPLLTKIRLELLDGRAALEPFVK
jgi:hypothetical protein